MRCARRDLLLTMLVLATVVFQLCLVGHTKAQVPEVPAGWGRYPAPDPESVEMYCANFSRMEWEVDLDEDNQLQISLITEGANVEKQQLPFEIKATDVAPGLDGQRFLEGRKHVRQVSDGWLVGFDSGEWGGTLLWFNKDGRTHRKLIDGAIVGLGTLSKTIVAFTYAAAPFERGQGDVFRIVESATGWEAQRLTSISSGPLLAEPDNDDDSMLVLARDGLFCLTSSGETKSLIQTNYDGLYPNSLVHLPSGEVYIGMRHFVTRLVPSGDEWLEQWLVPEDCTHFRLDEKLMECVCVGQKEK